MPQRLTGKVALISGAARGIGAATARLFVEEGAKVVLGDILQSKADELADELNRSISRTGISHSETAARSVLLDVTKPGDWEAAVTFARREFKLLNILINNAGITHLSGVEDTTEEVWQRVVEVNQKSVWLGMKAAVPAMREAGGGSIVNLSSVYGVIGSEDSMAYHGSKAAVRLLSKSAALQYASENIRVNTVLAGFTRTPMIDGLPQDLINSN
jgi:NAD(P)-dependent dehydrogenase (short-subunit alcohol dehydrogenase family)